MFKRTASFIILVIILLGRSYSGKASPETNPADRLTITNFANDSVIGYDLPLLKGTAPGSKSVTIQGENWTKQVPVNGGRWRAFVLLEPGTNALTLTTAEGYQFTFTLHYSPSTHAYRVRMVYVLGSDSTGVFDAPAGMQHSIPNAVKRMQLAARMLQSMTAELLYEKGLPRSTFQLLIDTAGEPVVEVETVALTVAQLRAMDGMDIWYSFYEAFSDYPDRDKVIDIAIIADTHYDPDSGTPLAHTALGGGRLGLFGSGTLYTWPETIGEIESRFTDTSPIPPQLFPEYARADAFWATYTTSLGAVLHEFGHCLGLAHPLDPNPGDIMYRGFDYLNRLAVTYEPGFGDIDPTGADRPTIMPAWTEADVEILQSNLWMQTADLDTGLGGPILEPGTLTADPNEVRFLAMIDQPGNLRQSVKVDLSWLDASWSAHADGPLAINLDRTQGSAGEELVISVSPERYDTGVYSGSVTIAASESSIQNSPLTIPVRLAVVGEINAVYLPLLTW